MDIILDSYHYRSKSILEATDALKKGEIISYVSVYESNVYIGTSFGQLLHFHSFEDSPQFILISQQRVRNSPIVKIVVLQSSERVVVLCGGVLNLYSLPELSPLQSGKLNNVLDVLPFKSDLLVITHEKIRIIRFIDTEVKLLKLIIMQSKRAVFHGKCLISANDTQYQLIKDSDTVPLFDYTQSEATETDVTPFIVPFKDKNKNEILLTIRSDESTTMGMFINDLGEPTRGTILWDQGYPQSLAVSGLYVLGIFEDKLIISSIEDLMVKTEQNIEEPIQIIQLQTRASIQNELYSIKGNSKQFISGDVILCHNHSISLIYQETAVSLFKEDFVKLINGEISQISLLEAETDPLYNQLLFLHLIYNKSFESITGIGSLEDVLLYLYSGDYGDELFEATKEVCDLIRPKLDEEFVTFALKHIRETYFNRKELQKLAYGKFTNSDEFIEFANKDKSSWKTETKELDDIIASLIQNNLNHAALHLYILLDNHDSICSLSTKFLSGEIKDESKTTFKYLELILLHLKDVSSDRIYRDSLLEVLRVDSKKALQYMRKNVTNHKSIHNEILLLNLSDDRDFAYLKLEVLENQYKDNKTTPLEILEHLLVMLKFPDEVATNNFMILYQTYLIENTFQGHRPVSSWLGFLQAIMGTTECKDFILLYLKSFELLNHLGVEKVKEQLDELLKIETYSYLVCSFTSDDKIKSFFDFGDYFAAEFYSIYGKSPYPPKRYYIEEQMTVKSGAKEDLITVFDYYRQQKYINAMKHFVNSYGSFFDPHEILNMLPSDFAVADAEEYFTKLFIELEGKQRLLTLKKIFNKQDAKMGNYIQSQMSKSDND